MQKIIILSILLLSVFFFCETYADPLNLTARQKEFIDFMVPRIEKVNAQIAQQRQQLLLLHQQFLAHQKLSSDEFAWLKKLAEQYYVTSPDFKNPLTWQQLLIRVDTLPVSLILAQSINESGWGQSRFAKEGNNYFGQWCSDPGCGLVPKRRKPGSIWQVRRFADAQESIVSYLNNLNRNQAYKKLREIRFELRKENKPLDPNVMAEGLGNYSQLREKYIPLIQRIINKFNLTEVVKNYKG